MRLTLKKALIGGVVIASALGAVTAQAQFAKPEDAVKYRQAAFTVIGNHFGRLAGMARGSVPFDAGRAQESARLVDALVKHPFDAFVPGSGIAPAKFKGDPLANMDDVRALANKAAAETAKLPAAAANLDALKAQVGAVGGACKECHDKYRQAN